MGVLTEYFAATPAELAGLDIRRGPRDWPGAILTNGVTDNELAGLEYVLLGGDLQAFYEREPEWVGEELPNGPWLMQVPTALADALAAVGAESPFEGVHSAEDIPFAVSDDDVTAAVDGGAYVDRKDAAMRSHPTQITVDGPFFALSNNLGQQVIGTEYYRLVRGRRGPAGSGSKGWEDDLFAGLPG
jgi:hypothetical protein